MNEDRRSITWNIPVGLERTRSGLGAMTIPPSGSIDSRRMTIMTRTVRCEYVEETVLREAAYGFLLRGCYMAQGRTSTEWDDSLGTGIPRKTEVTVTEYVTLVFEKVEP